MEAWGLCSCPEMVPTLESAALGSGTSQEAPCGHLATKEPLLFLLCRNSS